MTGEAPTRTTPLPRGPPPIRAFEAQAWQLQCGEVRPDVVLDLREREGFARAHLVGAVAVPYGCFQVQALDHVHPGQLVLVVDSGGARAAEMATWLGGQGVAAAWLEGGMSAWRGPLETPR